MTKPTVGSSEPESRLDLALHDLRQPLASALLLLGHIKRLNAHCRCEATAALDDLELALTGIRERVTDVERALAQSPVPVTVFDAGHAATEIAGQAKPLLLSKGIALGLSVPPGRHLIRGRRELFDRLLFNLLHNVARHAQRARSVTVTVIPRAERLRLAVVDDGVGWSAEGPLRRRGKGLELCELAAGRLGGSLHIGDGRSGGRFEADLPLATC